MNRRLFTWKASGILAALGLCSKSNADIVDDANFKPPAPKTTVKITEIRLDPYLFLASDQVQLEIHYDVIYGDGSRVSRVASQVGPRKIQSGRGLNVELNLS